ncbi:MAG: RHS repeat-associated core domain-containing protein [Spirochaetes bacterium]|nr:RHS repeat-associated core domain-containing protein [Spirochaetota bacterium]
MPAGTVYYSHNHLGSGALVTDSAGNEVFRITYTEYGEIDLANSGKYNPATKKIEHNLEDALIAITAVKYTGQEYDPETGFYYFNARYYDPQLGIFTTADTEIPDYKDSQSYNRHMYVRGNQIIYTDPSGHFFFLALAAMAIGALTSATVEAAKNNWDFKNNWDKIGKAAGIGAAAGLVGLGVGAGVTAGVAAVAGTGAIATTVGSISAGVIGGAAGGFTSGTLNAWSNGLHGSDFWNYVGASTVGGAIGGLIFSGMDQYFGDAMGHTAGGLLGVMSGSVGGGTAGLIGGTVVGAVRWAKSGNINDLWESMGDGLLYGAMAGAIAGGVYYGAKGGIASAHDVYGTNDTVLGFNLGNSGASTTQRIIGGALGVLAGGGLALAASGGMLWAREGIKGLARGNAGQGSEQSQTTNQTQVSQLSMRIHDDSPKVFMTQGNTRRSVESLLSLSLR